jgi:hypothetical protein
LQTVCVRITTLVKEVLLAAQQIIDVKKNILGVGAVPCACHEGYKNMPLHAKSLSESLYLTRQHDMEEKA